MIKIYNKVWLNLENFFELDFIDVKILDFISRNNRDL